MLDVLRQKTKVISSLLCCHLAGQQQIYVVHFTSKQIIKK